VSRLAQVPAYRVKVTLRDVKPPVWRRLVLPGFWHLGKVHAAVQASMGWSGGHLHEFTRGGQRWGQPDPGWDFGDGVLREERTRLHEVVHAAGDRLAYTYDFGDDWRHVLVVEELLAPRRSATCLAGRGACPPDDCGGPWGYENLLQAINDPTHPEHTELLEWVGRPFDPKDFNLAAADEAVKSLG